MPCIALSGCVAYPRFYWTTQEGRARLEQGRPVRVKAVLLKECETLDGGTQTVVDSREALDGQGRPLHPQASRIDLELEELRLGSECSSRVQMYVCRPECRPADDIDINILGK